MMKSHAICTAAGFILAITACRARAEDLGQAWNIAIRLNQGLQAQQDLSVAARFDLAAAKAARLPTVRTQNYNALLSNSPTIKSPFGTPTSTSGTTGATASLAATFSVFGRNQTDLPISFTQASIPLYTGGRLKRNIEAAGYQLNAQQTQEFRTALDLKLTVAGAYVAVLRSRRNLEVARTNVEQLTSFARDTKNRRIEGLAIRSDELAAEVSLANAQLSEIQARNTLEQAWATYNRYLCRPLGTLVELDEMGTMPANADWTELAKKAVQANSEFVGMNDGEITALTEQALRGRPELASLTAQARAQASQAESTLSNIRPEANVSGGFVYFGSQNSVPQGIGTAIFSLNWNITDSGATRRRAESIRQRERSTLAQRADLAADIALQIRTRWLDLRQAQLRIPVARFAVIQAEENIKVVQDRYRQQLSTYTEVLDAENRRVQSLNNFYNATYDESLAQFRLHRAVGDL
jgi:outer membrane protein